MKLDDCIAVITGASAGIGSEFARQLAPRAKRLILIARRRERLEAVRQELIAKYPALAVDLRVADLSKSEEVRELGARLQDEPVDLLINNAGLGDYGPVAMADPNRLYDMIQVNVAALTLLTRGLLPKMIARKRGAILNVSSSASFLPIPGFAVYAATKAYVTSFSEALRAEVAATGITISTLCPGPVHTEFVAVASHGREQPDSAPEFIHVSVKEAVRAGLTAIEHNKPLVIPGLFMRLAMTLVRVTPMPLLRVAWRYSRSR